MWYAYVRAVIFSLVILVIGSYCIATYSEEPKGNIDAVITVLQKAKARGATDVVVMITEEHDGPSSRRLRPITAAGMSPEIPGVAIILVIDGRET